MNKVFLSLLLVQGIMLAACGSQSPSSGSQGPSGMSGGSTDGTPNPTGATTTMPANIDKRCDDAIYPSAEWTACEAANFAKTSEGPAEFSNTAFQAAFTMQSATNAAEWTARAAADPSWISPASGNTALAPLCATHSLQCVSDPFQHPEASGPNGSDFYATEAIVTPITFYDQDCARLVGHIWKPRGANGAFPGIVIQNGSVQAPETAYWWAVQALVRAGYMVMTFDPRGQGRSDSNSPIQTNALTPDLADLQLPTLMELQERIGSYQGSNVNPRVFWEGLVNAIDFSALRPIPHTHITKPVLARIQPWSLTVTPMWLI